MLLQAHTYTVLLLLGTAPATRRGSQARAMPNKTDTSKTLIHSILHVSAARPPGPPSRRFLYLLVKSRHLVNSAFTTEGPSFSVPLTMSDQPESDSNLRSQAFASDLGINPKSESGSGTRKCWSRADKLSTKYFKRCLTSLLPSFLSY